MPDITKQRFDELVGQAMDDLPREFADQLDNIFVVVEETPSAHDLSSVEMEPEEADQLLGLYQGTPQDVRGLETMDLPDRVVIYRRSILLLCTTEDEVRREVRDTLVHELGHHFGLSDDDMPY